MTNRRASSRVRWPVSMPVLAAGVGLHGCDARAPQAAISEHDSAGVHIVENVLPVWPEEEGWRLHDVAQVDIGGGTADSDQLFRVRGAVRLTDGTIVIANVGSSELRYYDPLGKYLGAAGGEGSGPGEFMANDGPWGVWSFRGDSVATWDISALRLSVFDDRSGFGRTVTLRPPSNGFPTAIGQLYDARVVAWHDTWKYSDYLDNPLGTVTRGVFRYDLYGPNGRWLTTIAELPGFENLTYEWRRRKSAGTGPFGRLSWAAVRNDAFAFTSAEAFEILIIDLRSNAQTLVRILADPRAVTREVSRPTRLMRWQTHRMIQPLVLHGNGGWMMFHTRRASQRIAG